MFHSLVSHFQVLHSHKDDEKDQENLMKNLLLADFH